MNHSLMRWVPALLLAGATAAGAVQQQTGDSTLAIRPVPSPAATGSAQPRLSTSSRGVLLSWIERRGDLATLKFAERHGDGWSQPRAVASGRDWFVNWADVPSVIRLSDGTLYGHWLQKSGPGTYAYDVRLARSTDDGKTWSSSLTPHHDGTQTEHGFASLFQMPNAGLGLVWLDGRSMKAGGHGGHGNEGDMSVRSATFDSAGKQLTEAAVDLRACECCPTAAAVTSEGPIVAYRDRSPGEIRDISVSRFAGGKWSGPVAVHDDGWKIAACPVNGPALGANDRTVAIAWFTAQGDQGHAYAAFSSNAGASFGPPIRLDEVSALGRVDVALLSDGSALATWIEFADGRGQFKARRIQSGAEPSAAFTVAGFSTGRAGGYPRVAGFGGELVFAWTEAGETPRVLTATARVGAQ